MVDDNIDNKDYEPEAETSNWETSSDDEPPFDRNAHKPRHKQKKWMANNKKIWNGHKNKKLRMQEESYLGFRWTIQEKVFHNVDSEER